MADVFQVLADPTRRRMLEVLRHGERSVQELVDAIDISQPGISKQLRTLHEAGLVQVRPEGRQRIYSLRAEPLRTAAQWLSFYEAFWDQRIQRLDRTLKDKKRQEGRSR